MTEAQQAYKEAEKELAKEKIAEIKDTMKLILQKIQDEKDKKAQAEENLRVLKLDLDDLREGKIDRIKKRHEESLKVRQVSPITEHFLRAVRVFSNSDTVYLSANTSGAIHNAFDWGSATGGTYTVSCSNGTVKEFNF